MWSFIIRLSSLLVRQSPTLFLILTLALASSKILEQLMWLLHAASCSAVLLFCTQTLASVFIFISAFNWYSDDEYEMKCFFVFFCWRWWWWGSGAGVGGDDDDNGVKDDGNYDDMVLVVMIMMVVVVEMMMLTSSCLSKRHPAATSVLTMNGCPSTTARWRAVRPF